ncbi:MAG: hypothetical protein MJ121_03210 [Clostridia bacterium]|nr:hypothetical protein [Clostridia bacterium]
MAERKRKKWIILAVVAAVVLLVAGGIVMLKNYVGIGGQQLNKYSYSSGGGMTGGYHTETVKRSGDKAIISIEDAEFYAQDPTTAEYVADATVMDELEAAVRRHNMNFWNRKKFTNIFVADGETDSYSFDFDKSEISFSSQIYPLRYSKKLSELDAIVEKYIKSGEKLPGLVNPKTESEDNYSIPDGKLEIYVYSYVDNTLGVRVLNGTDEQAEIAKEYKLTDADKGDVIASGAITDSSTFSPQSKGEMEIKLNERLPAGSYKLVFGELEIPFEIK